MCLKIGLALIGIFFLIGISGCSKIEPINVSVNGLYFSDTGCNVTDGFGEIDFTQLNPSITAGDFDFNIVDGSPDMMEDIENIRSDDAWNVPIENVNYSNITETKIDGWPAIVGVIEVVDPSDYRAHSVVTGYIYLGDKKIKFYTNKFRPDDVSNALNRIKITSSDGIYNFSQSIEHNGVGGINIVPANLSIMGIYIEPGEFSKIDVGHSLEANQAEWRENVFHTHDLTIGISGIRQDPIDIEKDKQGLLRLITGGTNSSIVYLNINETKLNGWPALVAVMNRTTLYASGRSDPPEITINALVYVDGLRFLIESSDVWHKDYMGEGIVPGMQPNDLYKKLQSIKITLEPGAESLWRVYLTKCYEHGALYANTIMYK